MDFEIVKDRIADELAIAHEDFRRRYETFRNHFLGALHRKEEHIKLFAEATEADIAFHLALLWESL